MYGKVIVFAENADNAAAIMSLIRESCDKLYLICPDNASVCGADAVYTYPASDSLVCYVEATAQLIKTEAPELVLCDSGADGKLLAGYAAAKLESSPVCDAVRLDLKSDGVIADRMVYGGAAIETVKASLPAVVTASAGLFPKVEYTSGEEGISLDGAKDKSPQLIDIRCESGAKEADLGSAKKVVGIGRGLCSAENLPAAERLAELIGAEIGCTRPVSEEEHWYPKSRYIGVSGCMITPSLYLALGISGQVQHMIGVNQAGVIFAVDKNERSPIFAQADHCLVADLNTALPELVKLLENR